MLYSLIINYVLNKNQNMRIVFVILFMNLLFFSSCSDDWSNRIPETSNLQKGFTNEILQNRGNFTIFLDAMNKAGYGDLIQGKGLSTIFAPTDNVFKRYLKKHNYASIDDMDAEELRVLIGYHIIKYSYSQDLFLNFQPTQEGEHVLPGVCYKHRTTVRDAISTRFDPVSKKTLKIFNREKYLPVFNSNMFISLGIKDQESEYKYFYPKSNWYGDIDRIYPANAGVSEASIPTDNGYLYIVDQVIEPLRTIHGVMEDSTLDYSLMGELYDRFPNYKYDADLSSKYAEAGDSLFIFYHMNTPNFALLDIANEWTSDREDWKLLGRDACNAFVPNNQAMKDFFQEFWQDPSLSQKYESYETIDRLALFYLVNNHFLRSQGPTFPQHLREGLMNSWGYRYNFDVDMDVKHREICGNGVMYGIQKVEIPAIFETATRPVFQSPKYRMFSYMLMKAGMLSVIANKERRLTIFLPSDAVLMASGYTLSEDPAGNLSNYKILKDAKEIKVSEMESIIRYHIISDIIPQETITDDGQTWFETDRESSFLKLGDNRIVLENDKAIQLGIDEFNSDGKWGTWRAYEVKKLFETAILNITEEMEPAGGGQHPEWKPWILNWKNDIVKKTEHWKGDKDNLIPFANSRGILFCTHDSWAKPGQNGVPKVKSSSDKTQNKELTAWFGKHMLAKKDNKELSILDFMQGNVKNTEFQTVTPGFSIRILNSEPVTDNDFGPYKLTIQLPESEGGRIVKAYGPQFARECLFYILETADEAFVAEKQTEN